MRTTSKSIITASLVLPLLLVACNRADQAPTSGSSGITQEKMANPSAPPTNQMKEKSPPSPADASSNPAAPSSSAPSTSAPMPANEPKKEN